MQEVEFYLASTDNFELEMPRKCRRLKRLSGKGRDDLLLVAVEPELELLSLDLRAVKDKCILSPQVPGDSLFPVSSWPLYVHVHVILDENKVRDSDSISNENRILYAWGEIYRTYDDAVHKRI